MRKGFHPAIVLDSKGRLMAIATGSDATSEHEWGTKPMMEKLTSSAEVNKDAIAAQMRAGKKVAIPDLMQTKRIVNGLDNLVYAERVNKDGQPEAELLFDAYHLLETFTNPFIESELSFSSFSEPKDIAGAWDDRSFGFKVQGEKKVAMLRAFVAALREGKGIFAGTFFKDSKHRLGGVIIAIESMLRPEHRAAMRIAQQEFEADLQLRSLSRVEELNKLAHALSGRSITHIWPVWKDRVVGGGVVYAMNPGYNVDATYWGPYTFEQLHEWLSAGASTPLRPLEHA